MSLAVNTNVNVENPTTFRFVESSNRLARRFLQGVITN